MNILDDSIKNNSSANKRIMSGDWLNGKRTAVLYAEQLRDSKALHHDACGEAGGNLPLLFHKIIAKRIDKPRTPTRVKTAPHMTVAVVN